MAKNGNRGSFQPGDKRAGRRAGVPNRITREVREAALAIVNSPRGLRQLQARFDRGSLHPSLVQMLFHYAYGKPKDTLRLEEPLEELVVRIVRDPALHS